MRRSGLHALNDLLVSATETDPSKFSPHTDQSILDNFNMLAHRKPLMAPTLFGLLEKSVGLNFEPNGMLGCMELRGIALPVSVTQYDWMHIYLVNGIWNLECGHLLAELNNAGIQTSEIHLFLNSLIWPIAYSSKGCSGKDVFQKRSSSGGALKCSASEAIGVYSALRSFLALHIRVEKGTRLDLMVQCYYCIAQVLDLLKQLPFRNIDPETLLAAIIKHLKFFKLAHGEDFMIPKHHMSIHLAGQLRTHSQLISCWVHERKHKEVKRFANHLCNTSKSWESSVLESVMLSHFSLLNDADEMPSDEVRLICPIPAPTELKDLICAVLGFQGDVVSAKQAIGAKSNKLSINDCVTFASADGSSCVGQIWFHASAHNCCVTCISEWFSLGDNKFTVVDAPIILPTSAVNDACIYNIKDGVAYVVP